MEGYYHQVPSAPIKNPLFHDFFAGDSPEVIPAGGEAPDHHDSSEVSDSESSVTGSSTTTLASASSSRRRDSRGSLLVELTRGERIFETIHRRFMSCLGQTIGEKTTVVSIRRKNWSEASAQAKLQSFQIHAKAMANKNGGNPNVKFAWFGHERHRIQRIISHGFSFTELQENPHRIPAIFLSADDAPAQCFHDSIPDEDGLRHILLCRVILGKAESVQRESGQTHPSLGMFDSGLDAENPAKYIIWSTNMNTHILPEYIVTYRTSPSPSFTGGLKSMQNQMKMKMPTSPWLSFPALISVLGKYLPSDALPLINKFHKDYKEKRITRPELIQRVRQIAGDSLLIAVIKSCRDVKESKTGFLRNRNASK